ncbi:alpha,alpha-trehalose-phosphate synthase (UDP-forming) [Solitalea koreensis]|uniref:Trehalose-6-phosphate synthase n=1 Tax=Solitalea koreensis TaxID=543615 RepID=A0A521CEP0_9SPHI|nr:trehalose-6-phosphate synthase [Solitalea koreensis]SMO57872.1 Trehalose-6-phosphate synthase [Solitalea koreensis]
MKLNLALTLSIIFAVGLVVFGFTYHQISTERTKLNNELEVRTSQIAEEIGRGGFLSFFQNNKNRAEHILDSISVKYHLIGMAVYFNNDSILVNKAVASLIPSSLDYITQALVADTSLFNYVSNGHPKTLLYIRPIQQDNNISNKAIVLYVDADYIGNIISGIWLRNFLRWFVQALIVSFVTVVIIRWGIFSPINKIVEWVKAARVGNINQLQEPPAGFLAPLHTEIVHIAKAMHEAKEIAKEEALLRTHSAAIWTPERLKVEVSNLLENRKMVVVSNREPYMHFHEGKRIKCIVPASGMITAMEPILKACGGLWIASGSGDADRETVDIHDKIQVPPEEPKYTLRRLWQTKEEEDHFYYGFSNEGLWPLCHIAHTRPTFREVDMKYYRQVNENFAKAVLAETADEEEPFILIQDYHFALLPEMIKREKPKARVAIFWHIPWPNPESFGICPWQREILLGMLGADLIGFHTQYHCNHFLETVNSALESRVLWENFSVSKAGHTTLVKPFPISIAFTLKDYDKVTPKSSAAHLLQENGITAQFMGIGVDRIDYTKGIIEKFLAVERFLEKNPTYQGKFTFVQIGAPSRTLLKSYSDMQNAVEKEAERINWRFKSKNWKAILLLKRHHSHEEITPYYASADFCMVTSLHDGMNLVAKEFVATRGNNDGSLILSRFAGASQELQGAIIINPYDIEKSADAIKKALEMPEDEQQLRMKQMRQVIVGNNIYSWAADLIKSMAAI